jgi:hypothetical protein
VAELVEAVLTDEALRKGILETQRRALAEVRAIDFGALLAERLAPVLAPTPAPEARA